MDALAADILIIVKNETAKNGLEFLFRWAHVLVGIVWIGLLYYFNFVQVPAFAELDRSWGERGAPPNRLASVATDEERLIRALDRPEPVQLFALATDPMERANVAESDPATRDRLDTLLSEHMQRPASPWGSAKPVQMDRMSLDQLRALGYVVH